MFRFAAVVKAELEASGAPAALVARSGLDLSRFGYRYSHAGVSLKAGPQTPWSVRQLYFACDERRPRLFEQGMSAFLLGADDAELGYVSVVLLPPPLAAQLAQAAQDDALALRLLAEDYSANAYPYSLRYQNCNQWLVELLASALGAQADAEAGTPPRALAQQWLRARSYEPSVFDVGWRPLMWSGRFIPWIHGDDHPREDIEHLRYRVSMPASIEAFVQATLPGAARVEICHTEHEVVVHRGWDAIAEGCHAGTGDRVVMLD